MAAEITRAALERQLTNYMNQFTFGNAIINKTDFVSDIKSYSKSKFSWKSVRSSINFRIATKIYDRPSDIVTPIFNNTFLRLSL